ncbi:hypothetical protein H8B13_09540 [Hymenobacter sp. BT188]|uniref:hypothetical protein n=1 Tax=Hymenobacter sp. BT188 TaxID=2763504 RepID=UPI0016513C50|nr:hypothetical protein [Hymenobacter sp. BT188]MBC6607061.1 hypothetical protein [Hymenobacter sp. BT188]
MPVVLPLDSSDEDLLNAVRFWVQLLQNERYEEAYNYTHQNPYYEWSPQLIRDIIYGYGIAQLEPGAEIYKVTSIQKDIGANDRPYAEVDFHMPRKHRLKNTLVVAEIWFSLPLNDEWSDLIATFSVLYMSDRVSLELQEIHVF